jgi:hypothetical protein
MKEITERIATVLEIQQEDAIYERGRRSSPDYKFVSALILDLSASRTM